MDRIILTFIFLSNYSKFQISFYSVHKIITHAAPNTIRIKKNQYQISYRLMYASLDPAKVGHTPRAERSISFWPVNSLIENIFHCT